jgi:hypothetical protein
VDKAAEALVEAAMHPNVKALLEIKQRYDEAHTAPKPRGFWKPEAANDNGGLPRTDRTGDAGSARARS